jgi:acyl carrier protein|uniref:acyl carrier protein n=1 Tax=Guinardia delicatula TaxID=1244696 RepID=UPI0022F2AFAF|nr:acyl carrier protein [Guinardia delicatula]YP_010595274.1 acyl carrier protein [Guinardia delicatula]WAJ58088.1 acyl carrier protein [Guinardia delicatula]WAJ58145.1 acyl carrier protein [Guinardia delicatula]
MTDTLAKLQNIVALQLGIEADQVTPSSNFTKELGADSLDVVELVMAFEEAFEIDINDEAAGNIATVQDALDFIEENKA